MSITVDTVFEYITSLQACTTLPNTLDHSGRTHLSGVNARPWKINTSQPDLGLAERSPPVYILSTPGSGPIARCTPDRCIQGGSRLHHYRMVPAQPCRTAELDV